VDDRAPAALNYHAVIRSRSKEVVAAGDLVGAWSLQSWSIAYSDRDDFGEPFGDAPQGLLLYTAEGWMSVAVVRNGRCRLPEDVSPRSLPPERLAELYRSQFHYCGRYDVRDNVVTHEVLISHSPNFVGSQQQRHVELDGDTLVLSSAERIGEQERFHTMVWHRLPEAARARFDVSPESVLESD